MSIPFQMIVLDKPRKIKFGYGALITAQTLTGRKILEIIRDAALIDAEAMAKLLYAGLSHEDKDLTVEKVIKLVDDYSDDIISVMEKTMDALCKSVGIDRQNTDPNTERPTETQSPGT